MDGGPDLQLVSQARVHRRLPRWVSNERTSERSELVLVLEVVHVKYSCIPMYHKRLDPSSGYLLDREPRFIIGSC